MIDLPIDFKNDMKRILKEKYEAFEESYNDIPYKAFRVNTLKISNINKYNELYKSVPWCDCGYYFDSKEQLGKSIDHEIGLFYIQEPSAMSVVEALNIKNGDMVLDLCAAPGGKSTQIAAHLNGTGLLISNEIIPSRASILSSNIERMGIGNCVVTNEDPKKLVQNFKGLFNKILVDVPCSGEGMFRKNPLAINEWNEENVSMCADRQLDILNTAEKMLQDEGRIVFSTCTFSVVENEGVVDKFLKEHSEFHLVESNYKFASGLCDVVNPVNEELKKCQRLYPHEIQGEGHFFAILERGNSNVNDKTLDIKKLKQPKEYCEFVDKYLNVNIECNSMFGDNLYKSPNINIDKIKVVRNGLHLGELKKNRFEPSHSLCLYLKASDFKYTIDLTDNEKLVGDFIEGQSIPTEIRGWGAVLYKGHPVGWFKGDGNQGKNHYPKGLRKNLTIKFEE